jgi:choline kinase
MKAIILAAGYGKRMRPLTYNNHKTLFKVAGKSIIERIIDALSECNITEIYIVCGWFAEELKDFLNKKYPAFSINYIHNKYYASTNNIYSLSMALEQILINKDILLIESDIVFEPAVLKLLIDSQHFNTALVDYYKTGMDGTVVSVFENKITQVIPPHLQGKNFNFSDKYKTLNMYRLSKDFVKTDFKRLLSYYAKAIDKNCYYEQILGIIIYMQKETIHAKILNGEKWAEIDDPNDLKAAEFIFNDSSKKKDS